MNESEANQAGAEWYAKEQAGGWIPCGERLPEKDPHGMDRTLSVDVLVAVKAPSGIVICKAYYDFQRKRWYGALNEEPTHWHPIPHPPNS